MHVRFYREGEGVDDLEFVGGADVEVADLLDLQNAARNKGLKVMLNGEEQNEDALASIAQELRAKGKTIRVDGATASGNTPLREGSVVTASGEYKGA